MRHYDLDVHLASNQKLVGQNSKDHWPIYREGLSLFLVYIDLDKRVNDMTHL